jgi:DNA polymerase elongation subunit (family B)
MKLLFVDLETAPHRVYTWGLFKQNVSIDQIAEPGYTLCWAAKWQGEKEVMFSSILDGHKRMVNRIHKLLDEADAVCHYNGNRFDVPTIQKDFLLCGLKPPSPCRHVDLLKTTRKHFRLASNKLDFVASTLGLGSKVKHRGFALWKACMEKDKAAFKEMAEYNKQDVVLLEKVYNRLLPWISGHPNRSESTECCPKCESDKYQARGYAVTAAGKYPRFQCQSCGGWFRGKRMVANHQFRETA